MIAQQRRAWSAPLTSTPVVVVGVRREGVTNGARRGVLTVGFPVTDNPKVTLAVSRRATADGEMTPEQTIDLTAPDVVSFDAVEGYEIEIAASSTVDLTAAFAWRLEGP